MMMISLKTRHEADCARPQTLHVRVHAGSPAEPTGRSACRCAEKVSGLESRRDHAVQSSVFAATGPPATYGKAQARLKRFSGVDEVT